jgi:hypothetical protein
MFYLTPIENFSFADGNFGPDVAASEALEADARQPDRRRAYARHEMVYAITELFNNWNHDLILPMLRDDFRMVLPRSLPYGGEIDGIDAFTKFFSGQPGGDAVWESFDVHVDEIVEASGLLIARLTNTAVPKGTSEPVVFDNAWFFKVIDGRLASTQLYADTAMAGGPHH